MAESRHSRSRQTPLGSRSPFHSPPATDLMRSPALRYAAAAILVLTYVGCGEGTTEPPDDPVAPRVAINMPTDGAIFVEDATITLAATVTDDEDTALAAQLDWRSDVDGALGTGAPIERTLTVATHRLTASVTDSDGLTASDSVMVTVNPNTVPEVSVTAPANDTTVSSGEEITLQAVGTDAEDGDLSASSSWTSTLSGSLGVGAALPVTLEVGTHSIVVTIVDSHGASASDTVGIVVGANTPPTLSIQVPAGDTTVAQGSATLFEAIASDSEDGDVSGAITWVSDLDGPLGAGPGATVVDTLSEGLHTVVASVFDAGGLTAADTTLVTVTANMPPTVVISAPTGDTTVLESDPAVVFMGSTVDPEDGPIIDGLSWTSSLDGSLGSGPADSIIDSLSVGSHEVVASVVDGAGLPGADTVRVTVDGRPALTISPPDTFVVEGMSLRLQSTGTDPEQGDISEETEWSSSLDGPLGSGATVLSVLGPGVHRLRAVVSDSFGQMATDSTEAEVCPAPVLGLGDLVTSTLSSQGEIDCFTFVGTAGDDILLMSREVSGFNVSNPTTAIHDSTGAIVVGDFSNDQVRVTLPIDGLYSVRVRSSGTQFGGTFAIGLEGVSPLSPDTIRIEPGALISGSVGAVGETDLYVFDGTAGSSVFLTLSGFSGVNAAVFAPGGQVVQSDVSNEVTQLSLPTTGLYVLRVRASTANNAGQTGSYTLGFEGVPPLIAGDSTRVSLGGVTTGSLAAAAQMDFVVFDGAAGDDIVLTTRESSGFGTSNPLTTVYGPTGSVAVGEFSNGRQAFSLPSAGRYAVRVRASNIVGTGSYAVGLEGLDPLSPDTVRIELGALVNTSIAAVTETDQFVFDGAAGSAVFIQLSGFSGVTASVYGPTGQQVGSEISNELSQVTLPSTGLYTLSIAASTLANRPQTGAYTLSLEGVPPSFASDTVRVVPGDVVTGSIAATAQMDFSVFDASSGDRIVVTSQETSGFGASNPLTVVYSPTGSVVVGEFANGQGSFTAPATGTYGIRVRSSTSTGTGSYAVGVESVLPPSGDAEAVTVGGGVLNRSIGAAVETDLFTFAGTSGGSVTITVGGIATTTTVYDPAGNVLTSFTNGSQPITSLPSTGTYVIAVRATNRTTTGGYTLNVQ